VRATGEVLPAAQGRELGTPHEPEGVDAGLHEAAVVLELMQVLVVSLDDHVETLHVPHEVLASLRELRVLCHCGGHTRAGGGHLAIDGEGASRLHVGGPTLLDHSVKRGWHKGSHGGLWYLRDAVGRLGVHTLSGRHEHLREILDITASLQQLFGETLVVGFGAGSHLLELSDEAVLLIP